MNYYSLGDSNNNKHPIAILVTELDQNLAESEFLTPYRLDKNDVIFVEIYQKPNSKKTPTKTIRDYIDQELSAKLIEYGVEHVVVTDSDYFKAMTGLTKSEPYLGSVLPYKDNKYPWNILYSPGYKTIFYNPVSTREKIQITFNSLNQLYAGVSLSINRDVVEKAYYPKTYNEIKDAIEYLKTIDVPLAIDIECYSLRHTKAGIGTIAFSWNTSSGISFQVDPSPHLKNQPVRDLLVELFRARKHIRDRYHNASFDTTVLVYQLFMKSFLDTEGMLVGIDILLSEFDCTKIIKYLATNSTAGNDLGLKADNIDFLGNYAIGDDIKDITKVDLVTLLTYNLHDVLATNNTFRKHYPTLIKDDQSDIYENIFKPALRDIVQMQLTGLPLDMQRVLEVKLELESICNNARTKLKTNDYIKTYEEFQAKKWVIDRNSKLKTKQVTIEDFKEEFNPNSGPQVRELLYDIIGLPVIEYTKNKQPSTSGETLTLLIEHTIDPKVKDILESLSELKKVDKILTGFIPALLNAEEGEDGWHYLCGFFNLGGTVSGRLSSNNPNLQNLPATGPLAKLIKSCFKAPPGWIFTGIDFHSLEDRISALTTKDPNKLKVYMGHYVYEVMYRDKHLFIRDDSEILIGNEEVYLPDHINPKDHNIYLGSEDFDDLLPTKLIIRDISDLDIISIGKTSGYDGHSLRAYSYFKEQMPDINLSVRSINSIEHKYKNFRQESKAPTFALTYQGTFVTLMKNCGFPQKKAIEIEKRFNELYKDSVDWVDSKLAEAAIKGYVTTAFGLRVRTPILAQTIRGTDVTPREADAEGRTAGNALGQGWCLLNNRAGSATMNQVRDNQIERLNIRPCAQIHDAQYYLVRDNIDSLKFLNDVVVKECQWQDHDDIRHDDVHLGGQLGVFYPHWGNEIPVPEEATIDEIEAVFKLFK